MSTDVAQIEEQALEHLEQDTPEAGPEQPSSPAAAPSLPALRTAVVVATTTAGAAIMVGGIFRGPAGSISAVVAGAYGIAVAVQASKRRTALGMHLTIAGGIFAVGLLLLLPAGLGSLTRIGPALDEALKSSKTLRPPTHLLPGFRLMLGWLMATVGFAAGWVAIVLRRPALGLLVSLPAVAIGAVSVPEDVKVALGLVVALLFFIGLALLSSLNNVVGADGAAPSIGYEAMRALRALPVIAVLFGAVFAASRSDLLFPPPLYDPTRDAQPPKALPLSQVEDRVLFLVRSSLAGPWRIGLLDVYDGEQWRLPPFAESDLNRVPRSGVVDAERSGALRADFEIAGLSGAVLPGLANVVGVIARGPRLAFDPRIGNIRLFEGEVSIGLRYTVVAAALPTEDALQATGFGVERDVQRFLEMPAPPPSVEALLAEAPAEPAWFRLQFVRQRFLETVVASGPGLPVPVPPSRVEDMLAGSKEGTPFEIVAAQAMLARWAGIPARLGYGYDGGVVVGEDMREVRPKHGASWLEVWFPRHGWFPLIGTPLRAKVSLDSQEPTNTDPNVLPSEDVAVQVFIPLRLPVKGFLYERIRRFAIAAGVVALIVFLVYLISPAVRKAYRRRRRRTWALDQGPVARIEIAYAEFRDLCTDLGAGRSNETPLRFLDRYVDDEDHTELAWLVTRTIYGDLRDQVTEDDAVAAEELARTLRKRVAQAQPYTIRLVAALSRLSVRHPYAPDLGRKVVSRDATMAA